ncbi:histamine H2 receptor-like [Glandiceps talaboti]
MNNTTVEKTETRLEGMPWRSVLFGCIGIIGVLGNSLVCLVFLKVPKLRTLTNYLIVHQAIIDLSTSVLIVVYYLSPQFTYTSDSLGGEIICRVWKSNYLVWCCFLASSLNLVIITLERYYAIVYPLHHATVFTNTRVAMMLVTEWIIALIFKSFNLYVQYYSQGHCMPIKQWSSPTFGKFVGISNAFAQYFIPLIVMSVAYIRCIVVLKQKSLADVHTCQSLENAPTDSLKRARLNVLKMLILVFLAYALCWGPNQVVFFAFCMGVPLDFGSSLYHTTVVLGYINSSINPFIYALKYRQFQKGVRLVFCPKSSNTVANTSIARMET